MYNLPPDPYQALGVSRDVQLPEIRTAYRKLILKCHPDKVQDPQLKAEKQAEFQKVQQAYELLNDEIARSKYDEKFRYNEKFEELEKEKEKARMSSSPPSAGRTPSRPKPSFYEPEIRTAEPRPSTFAKTGTSPSARKFYEAGFSSSRSFEEVPVSSSRAYDEPRRSKKSASYERERDRDRDREWEREQEREKERERAERRKRKEKENEEYAARERERERERLKQAAKEVDEAKKKKERREKDKDKKKADKERKRDAEDKHRRHKHHPEPYYDDSEADDAVPVFERKSSSSRKEDTAQEDSRQVPTTERERKNSATLDFATRYLERSGAKPPPGLSRSPTYQDTPSYRHVAPPVAAPTPPPATAAAHPPPPPPPRDIDIEEDGARRSSGRSSRAKPPDALRSSARESRDKSSHRKSGTRSASRDPAPRPNVVEVAPGVTRVPGLHKSYSDPQRVVHLHRSYTDTYPRPPPHLERQNTWQQGDDQDRSRGHRFASYSDESEDDRHHRHSRRTHSPEPMVTPTRYAVASDGKTRRKYTSEAVPIPTSRGHKVKHVMANTSSPRADPGMNGYYHEDYVDAPTHPAFSSVKHSPVVREDEVQYSNLQRGYSSSYTKDPYTQVY